ncbi:MAG: hypothetical protein AAFY56_18180 [Pseudomonadota bacterium]
MDDPVEVMLAAAEIAPDNPMRAVVAGRQDIFGAIATTEKAALRPNDPGGISHDRRAALAARMGRLNNEAAMVAYYTDMIQDEGAVADIAAPDFHGRGDPEQALLRHVDLVTSHPRDVSRGDIEALKGLGWDDADIVRLSELVAFVNFQLRVVAGLRLMGTSA